MVEYYQLAHNVRHSETGNPVAEIIHNFGRADELDRDDLVRLCRSIARVCGVEVRDPLDSSDGTPIPIGEHPAALPEEVRLIQTLELGVPFVVEALWERLKLGPTLRKVMEESGGSPLHERALLAMVANRLCEPDSKLGVWDRWLQKVYMPSCSTLKLYQMYEAMDLLHWNVDEVENAIFFHIANLFNLVVDVIFYDTTTASFSIDEADEDTEDGIGLSKVRPFQKWHMESADRGRSCRNQGRPARKELGFSRQHLRCGYSKEGPRRPSGMEARAGALRCRLRNELRHKPG